MIRTSILLTIVFLIFNSCGQHNLSTEKKKEIIEEISKTMKQYYKDIETGGLLAEFKYLDSSNDFYWTPPGFLKSISFDSVASILRSNASAFKFIRNTWNSLEILPMSEKHASYSGIITSIVTDTTGKITNTILFEKGIVIKRKDGWKLLNGKTSVIPQKDKTLQ